MNKIILIMVFENKSLKSTYYIKCSSWTCLGVLTFALLSLSLSSNLFSRRDYSFTNSPSFMYRLKNFVGIGKKRISLLLRTDRSLETVVECVGPIYNQSCLYRNLYYLNGKFLILLVHGTDVPNLTIRHHWRKPSDLTPDRKDFETYTELESFVKQAAPRVISNLTIYFYQLWSFNIAHALFDGLYPAFVAFLRFSPSPLYPFRLLTSFEGCENCWVTWVCGNFSGLGVLNIDEVKRKSVKKLHVFDALIMGSANMCQRCLTPDLQLPGGVELGASRSFRYRMYATYGVCQPIAREKSSLERRKPDDVLTAYIVDNKRYTDVDRKELYAAINEINNYTDICLKAQKNKSMEVRNHLIRVFYLDYANVDRVRKMVTACSDAKSIFAPRAEKLINDKLAIQLSVLREIDIHVTGPGTGQFYQTFLPDGSVTINLGGVTTMRERNRTINYTTFMEQYLTSGSPYLKGLFYPINERITGIKREQVVQLIYTAARMIKDGFHIPVKPKDNLANDGQLFTELCERDNVFCTAFTVRNPTNEFRCMDSWPELVVHEDDAWRVDGVIENGRQVICPLNRTLLHELRTKYGIKH